MSSFVSISKDILTPVPADYKEVARYIGYSRQISPDDMTNGLIEKGCKELFGKLMPQAVYEEFPLTINNDENGPEISFADVNLKSVDLWHNLHSCTSVYLMACTIGPQVDAFIRRAQTTNPAYAAVLQSTGAMYIEKLVDYVNEEIKKNAFASGKEAKPRYSPGYGDVPLTVQKDFFRLLPCTRIGLTLMDTLIMAPEKSVTAFVGCYSRN